MGAAGSRSHAGRSVNECELVCVRPGLDLPAEICRLEVGVSEVDPGPDTRFHDLVGELGEAVEMQLLSGEPAAGDVEALVVGAKERLEGVHCCAGVGSRSR